MSARMIERIKAIDPVEVKFCMTDRQQQVIRLILAGRNEEQIAARLNISVASVKNHMAGIQIRLDRHGIAA